MILNNTLNLLLMASTTTTTASIFGNSTTDKIYQTVNSTFVINIIGLMQLNMEIKNFVFYISPTLIQDTQEAVTFLDDFWRRFPLTSVMIITHNTKNMVGLLDAGTLCFVMTTKWNDPVLKLTAKSLERQRYFKTIFLYFPLQEKPSAIYHNGNKYEEFNNQIRLLYDWVWERRFLNTILITINNQLYLYEAYPAGMVVNRTSDWHENDFFRQQRLNLKGWEIKSPVRHDVPRVFCIRHFPHKKRDSILTGTSGKLFGAFIKYINGSFNETAIAEHEFEPFQSRELLKLVESDDLEVEMGVHSYSARYNISVDSSYPVGINDWCLIVPFRNSTSGNMFLFRCFQQSGWILLYFASLYITVGIWLCTPLQKRDLSLSFLQTICSLLLIAPLKILILSCRRMRFIFMLLFVMGFCLTNVYLTKLATHLTASKDEQQINTVQDVIEAKLPLMVSYNDHKMLLSLNLSADFEKLMVPVHERVMVEHRRSLNTSYGYTAPTDRWNFIRKQQQFLKKPLFRRTQICVGPFYHVFPLQTNSDLSQPLMEFILDVQKSGLRSFWVNEAFYDALFLGYVEILSSDDQFIPLSLNFFQPIFYVWFLGLNLSALTFLWEAKRLIIAKGRRMLKKWA